MDHNTRKELKQSTFTISEYVLCTLIIVIIIDIVIARFDDLSTVYTYETWAFTVIIMISVVITMMAYDDPVGSTKNWLRDC